MKPKRLFDRLLIFTLLTVAILLVAFFVVHTPTAAAQAPARTLLPNSSSGPLYSSLVTTPAGLIPTPAAAFQPITWKELVIFLEKDHTNWNQYIPDKYTCIDFSVDLVTNAAKQNIQAWIVAVDFKGGKPGHAFVTFPTRDHGLVYVEPQADDTYPIVQVGKNLCDSWGVYQCMGMVSSIQNVQCDHAHDCVLYKP